MSDSSPRLRFYPATAKRWPERLARFHSGPQDVAAFCAAKGVSESNFYAWRRRLNPFVPPATVRAPAVVSLRITPSPPRQSSWPSRPGPSSASPPTHDRS